MEAYQQLTEFAVSIEKCKGEKEMANATYEALHKAMDGLQMLASFMMQTALFWKQTQEHCKALGEDKMKQTVENAMERYDDAKRRKLWTSKGFKTNAVNFYAGWVAFDGVCGESTCSQYKRHREIFTSTLWKIPHMRRPKKC